MFLEAHSCCVIDKAFTKKYCIEVDSMEQEEGRIFYVYPLQRLTRKKKRSSMDI